ncbi:uncharacterized protein RCC_08052 [Ramularia collo-cygni]|uniref:Uncharacterized protein n=1 Tax=Ramularia collo-cygni TaxID=112498 RepID=A0A2D3VLN8_9PEZI|nr:uncharacterized protein RCC_08052 [Ramularia collo-cygni]CZT22183.1 uncharacterized protein RCC_08052 [Ramularia collo-cygni]
MPRLRALVAVTVAINRLRIEVEDLLDRIAECHEELRLAAATRARRNPPARWEEVVAANFAVGHWGEELERYRRMLAEVEEELATAYDLRLEFTMLL